MSVTGRINVSALFHDTDGGGSLKVVSLEDSTKYTTGKVAFAAGTVSVATVSTTAIPYRDAAGDVVTFTNIERMVVSGPVRVNLPGGFVNVTAGQPAVLPVGAASATVGATAGVASYSLVVYGT